MGSENVEHGVYGTFIHGLGSCVGFFGAIVSLFLLWLYAFIQPRLMQPCCPLPNPYRQVRQGLGSLRAMERLEILIYLCTMQAP